MPVLARSSTHLGVSSVCQDGVGWLLWPVATSWLVETGLQHLEAASLAPG